LLLVAYLLMGFYMAIEKLYAGATQDDPLNSTGSDVAAAVNALIDAVEVVLSLKQLRRVAGVVQPFESLVSGSGFGGGDAIYYPDMSGTLHNGGTVWAAAAVDAWNGTQEDLPVLLDYDGDDDGCYVRQGVMSVTPEMFGAIPNDSSSDYLSIQKNIESVFDGVGNIQLPSGKLYTDQSLELPFSSGGGIIRGNGAFAGNIQDSNRVGPFSTIVWTGEAGGTLLKGIGNLGQEFNGFAFVGRDTPSGSRAGILYHCQQDTSDAFGSGCGIMSNVAFYDADIGVQMGTDINDHNCADWYFERFTAGKCDIAFSVKNIQGLNYNFQSPNIDLCDSFITTERGGSVFVTNLQASRCDGTASDRYLLDFPQMGDNRSIHEIRGLRLEQGCKNIIRGGGIGSIHVTGYEEAQSNQSATMVNISGPSLHIDGGRIITKGLSTPHFYISRFSGGQNGSLFVNNVHFDTDTFNINEWVQVELNRSIPYKITNSRYGQSGNLLIPDQSSHLVYGTVRHYITTTDASNTYTLLDGGYRARGPHNICALPIDTVSTVEVTVTAKSTTGVYASFKRRVVATNTGGTTSVIINSQTIGTDYNPNSWGVLVEATSFGGLQVRVTGEAGLSIDWLSVFKLC